MMSDYTRCREHGLVRCAVCSKRILLSPSADDYIKRGLGIPDLPSDWSPEDALDSTLTSVTGSQEQAPDKQSIEAAERLKPTTIEVDFGDDQPYVAPALSVSGDVVDDILNEAARLDSEKINSVAEETICLTCNKPIKDEMYASVGGNIVPYTAAKLYHIRCIPTLKPDVENPVVAAAQAYAQAEDAVIHAEMTVQELTDDLHVAEDELKRAVVDRDEKKLALQEQVK